MSITPRVLKEMAAGMAEGPLRTAKTIPLADALFDAAERIEHLNAENARLREALECLIDEQNGPPLEARAHSWQMAIDRACAALAGEKKDE